MIVLLTLTPTLTPTPTLTLTLTPTLISTPILVIHKIGDIVTWYNFASCTTDGAVAQSVQFLGSTGPRTLFAVTLDNGKDISRYSCYQSEKEVLVVAGTCLRVKNSMMMVGSNGCVVINLQEEKLSHGIKMIS